MTTEAKTADEQILDAEIVEDPAPEEKKKPGVKERIAAAKACVSEWRGFTQQPPAVADVRRRSGVMDARRIPGDSQLLAALWHFSDRFDRLFLLALVPICPLILVGPLLHIIERPSRRLGLYTALILLFWILPAVAKG
jgi:hypothetical protein